MFIYQKSLKRTFNPGFWVQMNLLSLCSCSMNSQRLFCSQKNCFEMFVLKHSGKLNLIPLFNIALLIALFQILNFTFCSVQYF